MSYREIIAVCSQIHTKHINTLCGQNTELYIKIQGKRAVNTFHLGYKNLSVYGVSGTSRCLFSDKYKHINTVWTERTVVEC
jgi:hypothetical protein